jgi:tetratricopeptide (TPR) repeat protein
LHRDEENVPVRINFRFLFLTVLVVLLAGGGVVAAVWWTTRPDYLYETARKEFEKGDALQTAGKPEEAKAYYEKANNRLEQLLDPKDGKQRGWTAAQLLQHKVLFRWASILDQEEKASKVARTEGRNLPSEEMATKAKALAFFAAREKDLYEAQVIAQDEKVVKEDDLLGAVPYSTNILNYFKKNQDQVSDVRPVLAAHYVMGYSYMSSKPVSPDAALDHVQEAATLQKSQAGGGPNRWRMVDVEMRARKAKIDQAKATAARSVGARAKADPKVEQMTRDFHVQVDENVDRVQREKTEFAPVSRPEEPKKPKLGQLSTSDIRGLLSFLALAIQESADRDQVLKRADLASQIGEMMTGPEVDPKDAKETIKFLTMVPAIIGSVDEKIRPPARELSAIYKSIEDTSRRMVEGNVAIGPSTYRQMAEAEYKEGRYDDALKYAKLGLDVARQGGLPANNPEVLKLNYVAAWVALITRHTGEAETYLQPLRNSTQHAATAHLIEGIAAVLDNRLEVAQRHLQEAQKSPLYKDNPYAALGLGYSELGLGKPSEALADFTRVEEAMRKPERLSAVDKEILKLLKLQQDSLDYSIFRCHVALGQFEKAQEYQKKLENTQYAQNAHMLMIGAYLNAAASARRNGKDEDARQATAAARKMIDDARKVYGDTPNLASYQVYLILNEPVAPAASSLVFGGAVNVDWMMRLARADNYLKGLVEEKKDFNSRFAWARWLERTGRQEEANKVLAELENMGGLSDQQKRAVALERAKLSLVLQQPGEYQQAIERLGDTDRKLMMLQEDIRKGQWTNADELLGGLKDDRQQAAEVQFLQGVVAQGQKKFQDAVWHYERAMQFAQYKARAQSGLLISLIGLAQQQNPTVAMEAVNKLLRMHPDDPAVLMAAAEIDRMLDDLDGMKNRLMTVKAIFDKEKPDDPSGPYLLALGWVRAGRPDLARSTLKAAIESTSRKHMPSVRLAGDLAVKDEDWDAVLAYAKDLDDIQPQTLESYLWKAGAYLAQGKTDEARKIYEELKVNAAKLSSGYMGLVALHERAKEYDKALDVLREWRKVAPQDANGLRAEVRLLALKGQIEAAEKEGDKAVQDNLKKLDEAYADSIKNTPPKDDKAKEERAKALEEAKANTELVTELNVAGGLQEAKKYEQARGWYNRALKVAQKRPADKGGKEAVQSVQMLLADSYLAAALDAKDDKAKREPLINEAFKLYQGLYEAMPDNLLVANNLAWILDKEKNDPQGALAIAEKARKGKYSQKPISGARLPMEFLDTLGVVYRSVNQDQAALDLFKEAAERYSNEPRVFLHLGRTYMALKQKKEAMENLTKGLRLADARLEKAQDPDQKAKLKELIADAQKDLAKAQVQ